MQKISNLNENDIVLSVMKTRMWCRRKCDKEKTRLELEDIL